MKKVFQRLKSVRLAVFLISYLTIASILATLVPQGASPEQYRSLYPRLLADLVLETGFDHFFSSFLFFLVPAFLFFANLSACTVDRFLRERRKTARRRHGPDILHVGLMLLVIGSVLSASLHYEESVSLLPGGRINLPNGSTMSLADFRFERYPDGRPKDWTSVFDLADKDGKILKEKYELRVNSPLRHGGFTFYQASYSSVFSLALRDAQGKEILLRQGEEILEGEKAYYFMAPEGQTPQPNGRAILRVADAKAAQVIRAAPGDRAGDLEVLGLREELATGIEAVRDPGYLLVLPAMLLVALGTAITFLQKIKENV